MTSDRKLKASREGITALTCVDGVFDETVLRGTFMNTNAAAIQGYLTCKKTLPPEVMSP